ncbi:uncharacterized protein TRIVIDRAFT_191613 [Trichoderma virens Gv29-8]|uniref:FAD/NAD(P)-binding domain-containing protein n=1 Tax=Hypocrea virens (strain Gv29-8 / FGSC 10586) TaxID=413071 RepID=G9MST3_HYPVG|nr:uncharacterized protein TRIVIDRAFT_191613 [Trichoderma virens Gv29-8]EHK23032.1 hypothetical protein TRIVIDRAFT_191613 [Trichoderma virens Gv29-8]
MTHNIVIVGAGFAGVWSALSARRLISSHVNNNPAAADIQVILIAPEPQLVLRPRLYEASPENFVYPLTDLFSATGIHFIQGTVDAVSVEGRNVTVVNPTGATSTQPYDRLIFAAGSCLVRPPIPGLDEHAFNVDQLSAAVKLENHLQGLKSKPSSKARNTVIVCGAGFTGIELATEMTARLQSILGKDADTKVLLVSRGEELGETLGQGPRPVISRALRKLGVETKLGTTITAVDAHGVTIGTGERIEAMTTIWTAGVAATQLSKQISGEKDALGRLRVDQDLRLPSNKEIFVAGDSACAPTGDHGHNSLMSCQHAIPMGRAAGYNAAADLLNVPTVPYYQPIYSTCLDLGPYGAVLTHGWERRVVVSGAVAKKIKAYINGTSIYPPEPTQPSKALAAANPAVNEEAVY